MAPKGSRKRKAVAAFRADVQEVEKATKKSKSLLAILEKEELMIAPAAADAGRDMSNKITKMIKDHFTSLSPYSIYIKTNAQGLTLVSVLTKDKIAGVTQGKHYYSKKRDEFDEPVLLVCFRILDESEAVDPLLNEALEAFLVNPKAVKLLNQWFDLVTDLNQMCAAALFKSLYKIYPGASNALANMVVNCMFMVRRLKVDTMYPDMVKAMEKHFDLALEKLLAMYKKDGSGSTVWWEFAKPVAHLVFPSDVPTIDKIIEEEEDFAKVTEEMKKIAHTATGKTLVSSALKKAERQKVIAQVEVFVARLQGGALNDDKIDAVKRAFMAYVNEAGGADAFKDLVPKEVDQSYNGFVCKVPCSGILELFQLCVHTYTGGEAVKHNVVTPMWFESQFWSDNVKKNDSVDTNCGPIRRSIAARDSIKKSFGLMTADHIKCTMASKADVLISRCAQFKVEIAVWKKMLDEGGAIEKFQEEMVKCFSDATKPKDIATTLKELALLKESGLYTVGGPSHSVPFVLVEDIASAIQFGQPPDFSKLGGGDFGTKIMNAAANMCQYTAGGSGDSVKYGKEAIKAYVTKLQEDANKVGEDAVQITSDRFAIFKTYAFLMTVEDLRIVSDIKTAKNVPVADAKVGRDAQKSGVKRKTGAEVAASVSKLFKN